MELCRELAIDVLTDCDYDVCDVDMGRRAILLRSHSLRPHEHSMVRVDKQPVLCDEVDDGAIHLGASQPALRSRRGLHNSEPQNPAPEERAVGAHCPCLLGIPRRVVQARRGASAPAWAP